MKPTCKDCIFLGSIPPNEPQMHRCFRDPASIAAQVFVNPEIAFCGEGRTVDGLNIVELRVGVVAAKDWGMYVTRLQNTWDTLQRATITVDRALELRGVSEGSMNALRAAVVHMRDVLVCPPQAKE